MSTASRRSTLSDQTNGLLADTRSVEETIRLAREGELNQRETQEAITSAQLLIGRLKAMIKNLHMRVAELELKQDTVQKSTAAEEIEERIKKAAKTFQTLFSPFPDATALTGDHTRPSFDPFKPERYLPSNDALGNIAEISHHLDDSLYEWVTGNDAFGDLFLKEHGTSRSHSVGTLRSIGSRIFRGVPQDLFPPRCGGDRIKSPLVRKLLGLGQDTLLSKNTFPDLFYEDPAVGDKKARIMGLFLGETLFTIGLVEIYGPSAAFHDKLSLKSSSPYAQKGFIKRVTPGFIAWCAIMARFILSNDLELNAIGVGAMSGINYADDFDAYKKIIIKALDVNFTWHSTLFSTWNSKMFPGTATNPLARGATVEVPDSDPESEDTVQQALAMLNGAADTVTPDDDWSFTFPLSTTPPLPRPLLETTTRPSLSSVTVLSSPSVIATEPLTPTFDLDTPVDLSTNAFLLDTPSDLPAVPAGVSDTRSVPEISEPDAGNSTAALILPRNSRRSNRLLTGTATGTSNDTQLGTKKGGKATKGRKGRK